MQWHAEAEGQEESCALGRLPPRADMAGQLGRSRYRAPTRHRHQHQMLNISFMPGSAGHWGAEENTTWTVPGQRQHL